MPAVSDSAAESRRCHRERAVDGDLGLAKPLFVTRRLATLARSVLEEYHSGSRRERGTYGEIVRNNDTAHWQHFGSVAFPRAIE